MLSAVDTEDFLSQLLGEEDDGFAAPCVSLSPLGSDSGISDDPSSSPHSEMECVMEGVAEGVFEGMAEGVTECYEAQVVETDHCYSLHSVRTDKPDTDVFIDLGELLFLFLSRVHQPNIVLNNCFYLLICLFIDCLFVVVR